MLGAVPLHVTKITMSAGLDNMMPTSCFHPFMKPQKSFLSAKSPAILSLMCIQTMPSMCCQESLPRMLWLQLILFKVAMWNAFHYSCDKLVSHTIIPGQSRAISSIPEQCHNPPGYGLNRNLSSTPAEDGLFDKKRVQDSLKYQKKEDRGDILPKFFPYPKLSANYQLRVFFCNLIEVFLFLLNFVKIFANPSFGKKRTIKDDV